MDDETETKELPKTTADMFFKKNMLDLDVAKDFFTFNLPKNIREAISLDTLALAPTEYLNVALRRRLADVVYTVKRKASDEASLIFLHVEQQSRPERLMPLRMLELMISILKLAAEHDVTKGRKALPVVIPVILSNHHNVYPYSTRFLDLFSHDGQDWMRQFLTESLPLVDLAVMPDTTIKQQLRAGLMEWALKHVKHSSLKDAFENSTAMLRALIHQHGLDESQARHYFEILLYFLCDNVTNLPDAAEIDDLLATAQSQLPLETGALMATLREHFEQRGEQRGMQQGVQQGVQLEAQRVAGILLQRGLSDELIMDATGLSEIDIRQLKQRVKLDKSVN